MHPSADPDVAMASASVSGPSSSLLKTKDTPETNEKYRILKRRFFELDEKPKETGTESQRTGGNGKAKEERNVLPDHEAESNEIQEGLSLSTTSLHQRGGTPMSGTAIDDVAAAEPDPAGVGSRLQRKRTCTVNTGGTHEGGTDLEMGDSTRPPQPQASSSGPAKRRSTRVAAAAAAAAAAAPSNDDQESAPKTRGSLAKRTKQMVAKSRITRSGSAARAIAVAATAQSEVSPPPSVGTPVQVSQPISHPATSTAPPISSPAPTISTPSVQNDTSSRDISFADSNIDPALSGHNSFESQMEGIVKVAEAAIAAQQVANFQKSTPISATPPISTTASSSDAASSSALASTPSSSKMSNNPYLHMGQPIPSVAAVPMNFAMNPYALYYPPGVMPPNPLANPYFYMMPPLGGMYPSPSGSNFPAAQKPPSSEPQRQPKPKRLKAHTVTSKSFSIPMVPRDKRGKPMLPLNVGIMTVISLGTVCMREHFHTERYIFPVGYEVSRRYLSTIDPHIEVVYHCTILDGGDGPKFQIIPSDVPDRPVIAGTATGAWSSIVKQANAIRNRQHSNSVSGPDFFGLGQNTIKHLIQELPNADRLRDYVWQTFVEGGPLGGRHAAVIPALPEEYDAALAVGAYYADRLKRSIAAMPEQPKGLGHYPQHVRAEVQHVEDDNLPGTSEQGSAGPSHDTRQPMHLQPTYAPDGTVAPPSTGVTASADGGSAPAPTLASLMSAFPASSNAVPAQ